MQPRPLNPPLSLRERWAAGLMVCVGVAALVVSAWLGVRTVQFLRSATPVAGVIARDLGPDASPVWAEAHPAVAFTTREGRRIRYQQHGGGRARVGTPVALLYDRRDPEGSVRTDSIFGVWGGALLALWLGLGFTVLPLIGPRFGFRADFNV